MQYPMLMCLLIYMLAGTFRPQIPASCIPSPTLGPGGKRPGGGLTGDRQTRACLVLTWYLDCHFEHFNLTN